MLDPFRIIGESSDWVVIFKPHGLISERNPWEFPSVEELVEEHLKKVNPKAFTGVVHRLDKLTSGLMVFAKKKSALKNLNRQFEERKVKKTYRALVELPLPEEQGRLENWLEKDQQQKRAVIHDKVGKNRKGVSLVYRTLGRTPLGLLLEIEPETGKFHQIRAQLAAAGSPIVGDEKYGSESTFFEKAIGLQATTLSFVDPFSGQTINQAMETPLFKWPNKK